MSSEPSARHPRRNWIIGVAVLTAVLFAVAFVLVLRSFNADAQRASREFKFGNTSVNTTVKNAFEIDSSVVGVDTDKNLLTMRLVFFYQYPNDYTDAQGNLLGNPAPTAPPAMTLYVIGNNGTQTVQFRAGQSLPVTEVGVNLNGRVTNYPFDKYDAQFTMFLVASDGTTNLATVDYLNPGLHAFSIKTTPAHSSTFGNLTLVNLRIARATSSLFFSVFIMVILWALALAGVAMGLMMTLLRRPIGAGVLGYLAALLFAFPQIRNALPGVPGVGAKVDYLAFFWAETIVAITLVVLAVLWVTREVRVGQNLDQASAAEFTAMAADEG